MALPRLGTISLMVGMVLLARHQIRARRSIPEDRYGGPSILIVLALAVGLSLLVVLPVRDSVNLLFEGGLPDTPPLLIWMLSTHFALLTVSWLVLRTRPMPGLHLFADKRPIRHALIGIGAGVGTQIGILVTAYVLVRATNAPLFQAWGEGLDGYAPPGVPLFVAIAISVALAPIAEEIFFRGLALQAWLREYGFWPALIGTSILFGLIHFGLDPSMHSSLRCRAWRSCSSRRPGSRRPGHSDWQPHRPDRGSRVDEWAHPALGPDPRVSGA